VAAAGRASLDKALGGSEPLLAIVAALIAKRGREHRAARRARERATTSIHDKTQPFLAREPGNSIAPKHLDRVAANEILGRTGHCRPIGIARPYDSQLAHRRTSQGTPWVEQPPYEYHYQRNT